MHKPDDTPPAGCLSEPTYYLEDRKGSVGLKSYVRYQKEPGGGFGVLCVRLEWTLTGKRALTRHIGGNRIQHLLTADLNSFIKRNLRLERVDHVALGNLLFPPRPIPPNSQAPYDDPDYRAKRAALTRTAIRHMTHLDASHHHACDMRGERRSCGQRVRDHFPGTGAELRCQCGRLFDVKSRPRANPVGGAGGRGPGRDGDVGPILADMTSCIALPNVDSVKIWLLAKVTPVKLTLTSSICGIARSDDQDKT